jgi:hypothetical protein
MEFALAFRRIYHSNFPNKKLNGTKTYQIIYKYLVVRQLSVFALFLAMKIILMTHCITRL